MGVFIPDCNNCTEKCPQAERAHETALGRMYATQELVELVKKIESGQLAEVVRCKDCMHVESTVGVHGEVWSCCEWDRYTDPDGYCHMGEFDGERITDANG